MFFKDEERFYVKTKRVFLSNLLHSYEEAVNIVPRAAGVQSFFVFLDLRFDEIFQLLNIVENFVLGAWGMLHDPGKDIVHLESSTQVTWDA